MVLVLKALLRISLLPPKTHATLQPKGRCSSGVERFLGKEEVTGSIPSLAQKFVKIEH